MTSTINIMKNREGKNFEMAMAIGKAKTKIHTPLFGIALIIFLFSYLSVGVVKLSHLTKLGDQILEMPPQHSEHQTAKSGRHYNCTIKFYDNDKIYTIEGIDYQYVNFEMLYKDLLIGDTLTVFSYGDKIYSLLKNEFDYCDLEAANNHRRKNKSFQRWLAGVAAIFFGFGFLLESFNKVREYYNKKIKFSWGCLSVGIVIIAFFVITLTLGTNNVTNKYDKDKSYKEILKRYEYKIKSR